MIAGRAEGLRGSSGTAHRFSLVFYFSLLFTRCFFTRQVLLPLVLHPPCFSSLFYYSCCPCFSACCPCSYTSFCFCTFLSFFPSSFPSSFYLCSFLANPPRLVLSLPTSSLLFSPLLASSCLFLPRLACLVASSCAFSFHFLPLSSPPCMDITILVSAAFLFAFYMHVFLDLPSLLVSSPSPSSLLCLSLCTSVC